MQVLTPEEMRRILTVTDAAGIHREAVRVPLARRGAGTVRVTATDEVEIVVPAGDFAAWLEQLPATLRGLDLHAVRRS
jgi:hypothetical protein